MRTPPPPHHHLYLKLFAMSKRPSTELTGLLAANSRGVGLDDNNDNLFREDTEEEDNILMTKGGHNHNYRDGSGSGNGSCGGTVVGRGGGRWHVI